MIAIKIDHMFGHNFKYDDLYVYSYLLGMSNLMGPIKMWVYRSNFEITDEILFRYVIDHVFLMNTNELDFKQLLVVALLSLH